MNKNKTGIYEISNTKNQRFYIGSSVDVYARRSKHFSKLRAGKHCNQFLQNDFNICGEEVFKFKVLKIVENKKQLLEEEQTFLNKNINSLKCYNICPTAGSTQGYKHTPENISKLSGKCHFYYHVTGSAHPKSKTVYQFSLDREFIAEYNSITEASKNTNTYIRGISSVCNGNLQSANKFLWSYDKTQIPKYELNSLKKPVQQRNVDTSAVVNVYNSIAAASRATGVDAGDISKTCNKKQVHAGGFFWEFV